MKEYALFAALGVVILSVACGCVSSDRVNGPDSSWKGRKMLVLGDSITDPGFTERWKNCSAYLPDMIGIERTVCGKSGHHWTGVLGQARKTKKEHGDSA